MRDDAAPIKLIQILSDGKAYSQKQLTKKMNIGYLELEKYIQTLKDWKIHIFKIKNQDYQLKSSMQLLNKEKINKELPGRRVFILPVVDSTNQYLLDRVNILKSGDVCTAEYQQLGRGRRGNQWFSPFGSNLYLSMYWLLQIDYEVNVMNLSIFISNIIFNTLQEQGILGIKIKWPNDIYLNNRKLAGILVEIKGHNRNRLEIVIGVGINLAMKKLANNAWIQKNWIDLQEAGVNIDRNYLLVFTINAMRKALIQFENNKSSILLKHLR
ncbi:biotin--[acetyl-CoA-carboxylase] ligase [Candidatus Erwinia haradaeae]|uniref:Bifunctional ligase/repressor BirA, partial n=1 Tax=Candidatus Erwinia haradaeae TaxID=1922217 RepID=A0A451D2D5_9GAMM|nr:biotin--[acetyl-CoA-carboxylase] ligase [Candidatus Erwinia haradaeae]VFP79780.1 Bifunctional ligase/repressor BirA [Candidatus Erwinia haradaeae]